MHVHIVGAQRHPLTATVSERIRADETLDATEVHLGLAMELGGLGTWSWDLVTGTGRLDERAAAIVGLASGDLADVRQAQMERVHPDDLARLHEELEAGIVRGETIELAHRVTHPDGTLRHVVSRARVILDGEEHPIALVGINRDVTAQRDVEAALRATEAQQAYLVRLGDALRSLRDPIEIQAAAARLLGEHLEASRVMYVEVDGEHDEHVTVHREFRREGVPSAVGRYRLEDFGPSIARELRSGRMLVAADVRELADLGQAELATYAALGVRAYAVVPLVKGGRLTACLSVNHDVPRAWTAGEILVLEQTAERTWAAVERARAEGAHAASEERYRTLFQSIDEGFCIIEMMFDAGGSPVDYRFLETNPAFGRQTGLRDAVGRTASELVPGLEAHCFEIYGRVALTGTPERFEHTAEAMGRDFDVYVFRVGSARDARVALLFNDATEQRRMQQERERSLEREREGREAAEAFLAVMSHELRTPVTTIYGTASLLRKNPARPDLPELLGDIEEESDRLLRIVDDLLVLSGVERGLVSLTPEPLLVPRALDEVLAAVRRRYPDVRLDVRGMPGLPMVVADSTALRQVLYNLLANAAKYAGRDGPITITVEATATEVVLSVLDVGPGLGDDPEALFGLFYRAAHTSRTASGTGIGLYVARQLVDAMGGRLEARPRPGGGAWFRLSIPLAEDAY